MKSPQARPRCLRVQMRMECPECGYPYSEALLPLDPRVAHSEALIIIPNMWWNRPLCWLRGGCTVTPYDYADNGWLFCADCGRPRTVADLHRVGQGRG